MSPSCQNEALPWTSRDGLSLVFMLDAPIMHPAKYYLAYLLFSALAPLLHHVYVCYPIHAYSAFLLGLYSALALFLSLVFCILHVHCNLTSLIPPLSRFERRHGVYNVFVKGLRTTVLLRVPHGATAAWILRELDRRHLVLSPSPTGRIDYELLLSPGTGTLMRPLYGFQDLETAGLRNNGTIYVRTCVYGGSSSTAKVNHSAFSCMGPCGRTFRWAHNLRAHLAANALCRGSYPDDEPEISTAQDDVAMEDAATPQAGPSQAAAISEPEPEDRDGVDSDGVPNPLGWGRAAAERALRVGQRATGPDDPFFDDDEEVQDAEDDEEESRIANGDPLEGDVVEEEEEEEEEVGRSGRNPGGPDDPGGGGGGGRGGGDPVPDAVHHQPPPQGKRRIFRFGGRAGEPVNVGVPALDGYQAYEAKLPPVDPDNPDNPYHPFNTKMDWELAEWSKMFNIGSNALNGLLKIEGLSDALNVQFRSSKGLNAILDKGLPSRSEFVRKTKKVGGEKVVLYMRNSLDVLRELYGRPDFANDMVFVPEKHYVLADGKDDRRRSDMYTGNWWWVMQEELENLMPGATIVPLIISSDKTQLTQFRNRSAYPVYLTIGNIPKELRRKTSLQAQILVGYLPVTRLLHIKNDEKRRRMLANLFHRCMDDILKPCKDVAADGVILTSGDGVQRRCHPMLAAFVGDYPEQVLVAGVKFGLCPKGTIAKDMLGTQDPCVRRDHDAAESALTWLQTKPDDFAGFENACKRAGVKVIDPPFWAGWFGANIYQAFTPDILHQLYQGMVKHLLVWLKHVYGAEALDERFKCLPDNHQLRAFSKGISGLSRVTGTEHQDICRVILGVIADIPLNPRDREHVLQAVRALLDFIYIAQFPEASTTTIQQLEDALRRFHAHKDVFIRLGARANFNFPKMHSLSHYVDSLKLFGTADNFNTAYSERLHIDCAKSAWRATNNKDEYPQMTLWLQRREQMLAHSLYIRWRLAGRPSVKDMPRAPMPRVPKLKTRIAKNASVEGIKVDRVAKLYGADNLRRKLTEYIIKTRHPQFTENQVRNLASTLSFPLDTISTFHRLRFWHEDAFEREGDLVQEMPDAIIARPAYLDTQRRRVQGTFNTALVDETGNGESRVGQVRVIFSLSRYTLDTVFGEAAAALPTHFAYVEWFSKVGQPERFHGLQRVRRSIINNARVQNERAAAIVPYDRIQRSVSLIPRFGKKVNADWNADNVLERCSEFYVNTFSDKHAYKTLA